jgi:hypothetical protein
LAPFLSKQVRSFEFLPRRDAAKDLGAYLLSQVHTGFVGEIRVAPMKEALCRFCTQTTFSAQVLKNSECHSAVIAIPTTIFELRVEGVAQLLNFDHIQIMPRAYQGIAHNGDILCHKCLQTL